MADVAITALVDEANANAQSKGFYNLKRWYGGAEHGGHEFNEYRHGITNEQLLHACIELGEAAQIFRKTGEFTPDLLEELADVFIVLADLIGRYDLDTQFADMLVAKLHKNRQRPQAYGNSRAKDEGISVQNCCSSTVPDGNAQSQAQQFPEVTVSVDGQEIEAGFRFAPDPATPLTYIDETATFTAEDMALIRKVLRDEWCCGNHGDCRCGGH